MKAVLSNRIFLEYTEPLMDKIRDELTYHIPSRNPSQPLPEIVQTFNRISDKVVSIPIGRHDLIPYDYEIIDKRIKKDVEWPAACIDIKLRESQQYVHDNVVSNCIINAPVAWGKTFTAMLIARKLRQKTLVVVHTGLLLDQWVKQYEIMFKESPSVLGQSKKSWDKCVTVATIQTLIKHIDVIADEFGTVIIDECHHIPATTFRGILDKLKAHYKIGLSGTVERKDGKHVIFNDYFGSIRFAPAAENYMKPEVLRITTDIFFSNADDFNAKNFASMLTLLANKKEYVDCILSTSLELAAVGHVVLCVSERIDLLKNCYEQSKEVSVLITGELNAKNRELALDKVRRGQAKIIWGSMNIFSEGFSENMLSCLVLAAQINNEPLLTQLIGRVTRLYPNKKTPIIVDVSLMGKGVQQGARNRLLHYANCGYKIHTIQRKYGNL